MTKRLRWFSGLMVLLMVFGMFVTTDAAQAAKKIKFTKHPIAKTVAAGEGLTFSFGASGYKAISWRLVSPDGETDIHARQIPDRFPGVKVKGVNSRQLVIKNVAAEMDGWKVYCRLFQNGIDPKDSDPALITVLGEQIQPSAQTTEVPQAPETIEAEKTTPSDGMKHIRTIGCTFTNQKQKGLTELAFEPGVSVNIKITAKKTPAYWVINGTRYDFDPMPKSIDIWGMRRNLTVEAVMKGKKPTTLLSAEEIQAGRTGDQLKVSVDKTANLCHITRSGAGKGGWFGSLDFTEDYTNRATKKKEVGGRTTVRIKPVLPIGKGVAGYKFMGATWNFNKSVTSFVVHDLRESMHFQTEYYDLKQCHIVCVNCSFTAKDLNGVEISGKTEGDVWQGTSIKVTGYGSGKGHWEGIKTTDIVENHNLRFTVNKSGTITWVPDP